MSELENELNNMIEIFDYYNIPEERQKFIITSGVYFEFNRNESVKLDCFMFSRLLMFCKRIDPNFNVNKMLDDLNNRRDSDYEFLVKCFIDMDHKGKEKSLTMKIEQD